MKKTLLLCLIFSVFSALYSNDSAENPNYRVLQFPRTVDDFIQEYKNPKEKRADILGIFVQMGIFNYKNDPKFTEKISKKHKNAIAEMERLQKKYIKEELRIKDGTLTVFPQYEYGIPGYLIDNLEMKKTFSKKDLPVSKRDLLLYESKDGKSFIMDSIDSFVICFRGENNPRNLSKKEFNGLGMNIIKEYTNITSFIPEDRIVFYCNFPPVDFFFGRMDIKDENNKPQPSRPEISYARGPKETFIIVMKTKEYLEAFDYKPYFK